MSKAPAYPMYAQDFDMDTKDWTALEVGIYIRLLNYEWVNGGIPADTKRICRIAGVDARSGKHWMPVVIAKFALTEDTNMYVNRRLEEERQNQANYRESQRIKGKKSGDKRRQKTNRGSTGVEPEHEPEGNLSFSSSFSSSKEKKIFIPPTLEEVTAYCQERGKGVNPQKWLDHYTSNGWMVGKNKMKDWKAAVRTWEPDKPQDGGIGYA